MPSLQRIIAPAFATGSRQCASSSSSVGGSPRAMSTFTSADAISMCGMRTPNMRCVDRLERVRAMNGPRLRGAERLEKANRWAGTAGAAPRRPARPDTSTSTTLPARLHFRRSSTRSTRFCRTTPASTEGPASSHASARRPMTRRTTRSRASSEPTSDTNTVIFGKNTTEAINKLAYRYPLGRRNVVLSTAMEHHSNDLPWRGRAHVVRAKVTRDGRLDEDDVDRLLAAFGDRIALLTVSGASNVTGFVQPIHRLARKAHAVGARILVDAAQLAPHRRIDVKPDDDAGASRFRGVLGSQDVRAVRHRGAGRPPRHLPRRATRSTRAAERSTS